MISIHLNLKTRLILITLIALLGSAGPSSLLIRQYSEELEAASREHQGVPANSRWQAALKTFQQHRQLAAESLSTRPAARDELAATQKSARAALAELSTSLDAGFGDELSSRHRRAVQSLRTAFDGIASDLANGKLDLPKLLLRQQALAAQSLRAMDELNGDSGLLFEADPGLHYAAVAGLQAAPRVGDALSELSSIARAAAIDDIAQLSAALTRYREEGDAMQHQMQQAIEAAGSGSPLAQVLIPLLPKAQAQRRLVDDALQAAALDVNYPLDQLAASFSSAAALQAELSAEVLKTLDAELARRRDAIAFKRNAVLAVLPLLLAVLGAVMLRAMQQLLAPVRQMIAVTERIAAGDLSQAVPPARPDEMGRVLTALDHMQKRLRQLVEQLHAGAGNIRTAAREIADGNQDLATRTERAAAHLQQTSSNVDLLDQVVHQNARAAGEAALLARQASGVAADGGAVVEQVMSTMASIHESSSRIADITGLIDSIAFRTNILALNAAVEAARAGEHGRGFAVVAAEVRALAGRSAEAAGEIKALIQRSVDRVESGSSLASDAGRTMQKIVSQVNQVSAVIQGMDSQSRSQAGQTNELGNAVRVIDAMTQQNAALVEQSAASALSLRGQAEVMDAAVQTFKL